MKIRISTLLPTILVVALCSVGSIALAQPDPVAPPPDCSIPGACIPLDGGLSILIAAGLLYGGKKAVDLNKRK